MTAKKLLQLEKKFYIADINPKDITIFAGPYETLAQAEAKIEKDMEWCRQNETDSVFFDNYAIVQVVKVARYKSEPKLKVTKIL